MPPRPATSQPQAARPETAPPVRFALAPALASGDIIDFATPAGAKLFKAGTDALPTAFDCTAVNLQLFLDQLKDKVAIFNWDSIIMVPGEGHEQKSLLDQYGELTYEQVKAHVTSYVATDTRQAQDSFMLYNCIMNSLNEVAQKQVRNRGLVTSFHHGGRGSGALLLKVVIMVSHVDTRATVTAVRTKLSSLDSAMKEHNSDIMVFNDHVLSLVSQLHARGEQTQDLLVNLFKGYKACRDAEFVEYIKKKEDVYEEGGQVEYNQLMDWAINKFKSRKEAGTWGAKTTEEETIIALQAQIKKLVSAKGKEKFKPKKKQTQEVDAWMKEAPAEGQSKTKKVNNRKFYWCHHHSLWTRHSPDECQKARSNKAESKTEEAKQGGKAKMDKALTTVAYQVSDEEEE